MTPIPQAQCCYSKDYRLTLSNPPARTSYATHENACCEAVHALAERCCWVPFSACLHAHSYSATPFYGYNAQPCPGSGKEAPEWQKGAKRVICCAACVLLTPLAIPSICLGMSLRCMSHNNRPFLNYLQTSQTLSKPLSLERPFHVATANAGLNPSSVAIAMDLRPPHIRAQEIVDSFIGDPQAPTLVIIQELWSERAVEILVGGLRPKYAHMVYHIGPAVGGMASGYFVASQHPIVQIDFIRFREMKMAHSLPPRGVLGVHLITQENERLIVYGFHAQSMDGKEEALIRAAQFKQVKEVVDSDQGLFPGVHQVIVGDTNTTRLDQWGFDTADQMEAPALTTLNTLFDDLFLRDHDPLTGNRTSGTPSFLAADNERLFSPLLKLPDLLPTLKDVTALTEWIYSTLLPEPTGSWYVGPFQPIPQGLHETLTAQRQAGEHPAPTAVVTPDENVWGTSRWFYSQPVNTARYDAVLLPRESRLDGRVEYRRYWTSPEKESPPSDHAIGSALICKKSPPKAEQFMMQRNSGKSKED